MKVEAVKALPRLAGGTPEVIDGLCRRLRDDDSAWVQLHAALALGQLGAAAAAAGGALLRAAQTGEVGVREQAMRAIAMIQPPETPEALVAGLKDACGEIRVVASAGWMKAAAIPDEAIPGLVDALRDPEVQVRANVAHALARLDPLPAEAVPLLVACAGDPDEGLRLRAVMALKLAPAAAVTEALRRLVADPNSRIRLIAAGCLLTTDPGDAEAGAVLVEALADPSPRIRKAALDLVDSLGAGGSGFLEALKDRETLEAEGDIRDRLTRLVERLSGRRSRARPSTRRGLTSGSAAALLGFSPGFHGICRPGVFSCPGCTPQVILRNRGVKDRLLVRRIHPREAGRRGDATLRAPSLQREDAGESAAKHLKKRPPSLRPPRPRRSEKPPIPIARQAIGGLSAARRRRDRTRHGRHEPWNRCAGDHQPTCPRRLEQP